MTNTTPLDESWFVYCPLCGWSYTTDNEPKAKQEGELHNQFHEQMKGETDGI